VIEGHRWCFEVYFDTLLPSLEITAMPPTFAATNPAAKESKLKKLRGVFHRTSSSSGPLDAADPSPAQANVASQHSSTSGPIVVDGGKPSSSSISSAPSSSNTTSFQAPDPKPNLTVSSKILPRGDVSPLHGSGSKTKYVIVKTGIGGRHNLCQVELRSKP